MSSSRFMNMLASGRVAVVLLFLVMLISCIGAVIPQEGMVEPAKLLEWREANPVVARTLGPLGAFHTFTSWPFMVVIFALGLNTFACTANRFSVRGVHGVNEWGSLLFHISLLLLLAGGLVSAATRFDGSILLTEGQNFRGARHSYLQFSAGPFRRESRINLSLTLTGAETEAGKGGHLTRERAYLTDEKTGVRHEVEVNRPKEHNGFTFTLGRTGFSPKLAIRGLASGRAEFAAFVSLKTFGDARRREYRDFLELDCTDGRLVMALYPDAVRESGKYVSTGGEKGNPVLHMEWSDEEGHKVAEQDAALGTSVNQDGYSYHFAELRRWASFKVVDDPGYPIVVVALWLGLLSLLVRYMSEMVEWFKKEG